MKQRKVQVWDMSIVRQCFTNVYCLCCWIESEENISVVFSIHSIKAVLMSFQYVYLSCYFQKSPLEAQIT